MGAPWNVNHEPIEEVPACAVFIGHSAPLEAEFSATLRFGRYFEHDWLLKSRHSDVSPKERLLHRYWDLTHQAFAL
jgi:hypothetical protein